MKPTEEQLEFIGKTKNLGMVPGLEGIRALLRMLGDPQDQVPCIHVAGTNGKGSVCAYLGSVLTLAGYRVGVYTSPAVFHERERYTVMGEPISEEAYWSGMERIRLACEALEAQGKGHPTIFEVETSLAYWMFAESGCEIAIVETGMGGALDATNVIKKPLCSVITSIDMDHMKFLGNTLEEIAVQKAGIIKTGCDVVSVWQNQAVERILRETAKKKNAVIRFVPKTDCRCLEKQEPKEEKGTNEKTDFSYEYRGMFLSPGLEGACQIPNSALSAEVLLLLREKGYTVDEAKICEGIRRAFWPGRMQQISSVPEIWIDGAHNPAAAVQLKKTIENKFTNRRITYIMGVLADKDYRKMLGQLLPLAQRLITVTPDHPRALSAGQLARAAKEQEKKNADCAKQNATEKREILAAESFEAAARMVLTDHLCSADVIIAFGSLSFLKDICAALEKRKEEMSYV